MKNLIYLLQIGLLAMFIISCKPVSSGEQSASEFDSLLFEFNTMYGVKSNLQTVAEVMIKSGVDYRPELTLDTLIQAEYLESPEASAFICGVFSADALYHAAFGNNDAGFESYTSAQVMANQLGIGPFYVENLLLRREDTGLTEEDSLLFKFDEVLAEFDTTLPNDKRFRIISSYLIGNITEKLYLIDQSIASLEGMKVADITNQGKFLYDLRISEKKTIDLFVSIFNKYAVNKGNKLHTELMVLQALYEELYKKGLPDYKPDDIYQPTEELQAISEQIGVVRSLFVIK
ncbi:MAG TPA: hypothetical protein DDX98_15215 [Bacteroidales bacterium]|nr:hypothetical protein [Bacteroidales bacterium]